MKLPVNYEKLTWQERKKVRDEYIRVQGGLCYHCNKPLAGGVAKEVLSKRLNIKLFPPNFLKYPVHLHHCHNTGRTLGAVHSYCNGVLWQYYGE